MTRLDQQRILEMIDLYGFCDSELLNRRYRYSKERAIGVMKIAVEKGIVVLRLGGGVMRPPMPKMRVRGEHNDLDA